MPVHILHLHSAFDLGGKEARAVRLMNAFGDAARHTIVSGVPEALSARAAIAPCIKYEIPSLADSASGTAGERRSDLLNSSHQTTAPTPASASTHTERDTKTQVSDSTRDYARSTSTTAL